MYTYGLCLVRQAVIYHMSKHLACVNQLVSKCIITGESQHCIKI